MDDHDRQIDTWTNYRKVIINMKGVAERRSVFASKIFTAISQISEEPPEPPLFRLDLLRFLLEASFPRIKFFEPRFYMTIRLETFLTFVN